MPDADRLKSEFCVIIEDEDEYEDYSSFYYYYKLDIEENFREEKPLLPPSLSLSPSSVFRFTKSQGARNRMSFGLLKSKLYAIGGLDHYDENSYPIASPFTWVYDFDHRKVEKGPDLNAPRLGYEVARVNDTLYLFPENFMPDMHGKILGFEFLDPTDNSWKEYKQPCFDMLRKDDWEQFYDHHFNPYSQIFYEFLVTGYVVCGSKIMVSTSERGKFIYDVMKPDAGWEKNDNLKPFPFSCGVCVGGTTVYAVAESGRSLQSYNVGDKGEITDVRTLRDKQNKPSVPLHLFHLRDDYFCLFGMDDDCRPVLELLEIPSHDERARSISFYESKITPPSYGSISRFADYYVLKVDGYPPSTQRMDDGEQKKIEALSREKEDLGKDNQQLSRQSDEMKQARKSTSDAIGEQAMKEEKDILIQEVKAVVENFEKEAHSVLSKLGGRGNLGDAISIMDCSTATGSVVHGQSPTIALIAPTTSSLLPKATGESEQTVTLPKANIDICKPSRRLVRPHLVRPKEPYREMSDAEGPGGKLGPSSGTKSQPLAHKHVSLPSTYELYEESATPGAKRLKKSKGSDLEGGGDMYNIVESQEYREGQLELAATCEPSPTRDEDDALEAGEIHSPAFK